MKCDKFTGVECGYCQNGCSISNVKEQQKRK